MSFVISPGVIVPPLTAGGVAYGTGTQAKVSPAGTSGLPLVSAGAAVPNFAALGAGGGGTGRTSLTLNNVLLGNGTNQVQFVAPGTSGNVLTSNGTTWTSATPATSGGTRSWTSFTASGTYTVPTGITSIRVYAFGRGGNGSGAAAAANCAGGGGGGCAFGDLAVTAGQVVTITISGGVVTVDYASITRFTANPGNHASGGTQGTGGTASIHASVTNGGAYTGGSGGSNGGGGGSSGSPLGNGYDGGSFYGAGGGGWGGSAQQGGGGVGGASTYFGGGGAGAAATGNTDETGGLSRDVWRAFSDPLLAECNAAGGFGITQNDYANAQTAGPGGGGGYASTNGSNRYARGGSGGLGGGGGGASGAFSLNCSAKAGGSTLGGGGGSAAGDGSGPATGGSPDYAGGGGAAVFSNTRTPGTGAAGIVLILA